MNKEYLEACHCGGKGQYFCHVPINANKNERYSVACLDCGEVSEESSTQEDAAAAWNKKQHSARLLGKSKAMSQKMISMGLSPLPLWIQMQSIDELTDQ